MLSNIICHHERILYVTKHFLLLHIERRAPPGKHFLRNMATSVLLLKGVAWLHKTPVGVFFIDIPSVAINMSLTLSVPITILNVDTYDFSIDTMSSSFNKPT